MESVNALPAEGKSAAVPVDDHTPCAWCGGYGAEPTEGREMTTCPVCGGSGLLQAVQRERPIYSCPDCGGDEAFLFDGELICLPCIAEMSF
jgi:DnaJ-class molecular chaperone